LHCPEAEEEETPMSGPPKYRPKPKPKPKTKPKAGSRRKFTVQPLDCLITLHEWYIRNKLYVDRIVKELAKAQKKHKSKHPPFDQIMGGIEKCITRTLEAQADEQITPEVQEIDLDDPENIPF
jgi:hypothetical protein